MSMEESNVSKIFRNEEFLYWSVTVERPLRLRVYPERPIPREIFKKPGEYEAVRKSLEAVSPEAPRDDWAKFAKALRLKADILRKIRQYITEKDPSAQAIAGEADPDLRDIEAVPFTYPGGVEAFMRNEVRRFAPDAYIDESKTQTGCEISFTKYFYRSEESRSMAEILVALKSLEEQGCAIMAGIEGDIS